MFASLPKYWTRGPVKTQRGGGRGVYAGTYRGRVLSVTSVVGSGMAYSHRWAGAMWSGSHLEYQSHWTNPSRHGWGTHNLCENLKWSVAEMGLEPGSLVFSRGLFSPQCWYSVSTCQTDLRHWRPHKVKVFHHPKEPRGQSSPAWGPTQRFVALRPEGLALGVLAYLASSSI